MKSLIPLLIILISLSLISFKDSKKSALDFSQSKSIIENDDTTLIEIVELPRPNSGTFSFEEAEKRKNEIFGMQLTDKYLKWENPTSGGAIHITKNDEIEVYQSSIKFISSEDKSVLIESEELMAYVSGFGFGNPASMLITSELDLNKSKSFELILNELFEPGIQLYYLKKK